MGLQLHTSKKMLSLKNDVMIRDESNEVRFTIKRSFGFFNPRWRILEGEEERVSVQRKLFAFRPTWVVAGELGDFKIERKVVAVNEHYQIKGGPMEGWSLDGNFMETNYKMSDGNRDLAVFKKGIFATENDIAIEIDTAEEEKKRVLLALSFLVPVMEHAATDFTSDDL